MGYVTGFGGKESALSQGQTAWGIQSGAMGLFQAVPKPKLCCPERW